MGGVQFGVRGCFCAPHVRFLLRLTEADEKVKDIRIKGRKEGEEEVTRGVDDRTMHLCTTCCQC